MSRSTLIEVYLLGCIALAYMQWTCPESWAAPCCSGCSAIPSLITGDDQAQLTFAISHGQVIGDAPPQGIPIFRAQGDIEQTQVMRFDGAYRFADRFQAGLGIPMMRRARQVFDQPGSSSSGIGDAVASIAYEILPEWTYSAWRPHGFLFLQTTFPSSPSVYDAQDSLLLDARGRGFFSIAVGGALLKTIHDWDFILSGEAHRSFSRTLSSPDGGNLTLIPGFGGSVLMGAGFNPGTLPFRFGVSISPIYEGGISSLGEIVSQSDSQLVWNTSLQIGYLISPNWSTSLAYIDQTLLGPARNVSLSRTISISLQKRWEL